MATFSEQRQGEISGQMGPQDSPITATESVDAPDGDMTGGATTDNNTTINRDPTRGFLLYPLLPAELRRVVYDDHIQQQLARYRLWNNAVGVPVIPITNFEMPAMAVADIRERREIFQSFANQCSWMLTLRPVESGGFFRPAAPSLQHACVEQAFFRDVVFDIFPLPAEITYRGNVVVRTNIDRLRLHAHVKVHRRLLGPPLIHLDTERVEYCDLHQPSIKGIAIEKWEEAVARMLQEVQHLLNNLRLRKSFAGLNTAELDRVADSFMVRVESPEEQPPPVDEGW